MVDIHKIPQAYTETLTILNNINIEEYKKIPSELIDMFIKYKDTNYEYTIKETDFEKQPILEETKIILAILFKNYWATPNQKEKIKLKENYDGMQEELIKREMYNPDNLFIKSDKQENVTECVKNNELSMVKYKESLFKKIWNKLTNILKSIKSSKE